MALSRVLPIQYYCHVSENVGKMGPVRQGDIFNSRQMDALYKLSRSTRNPRSSLLPLFHVATNSFHVAAAACCQGRFRIKSDTVLNHNSKIKMKSN